jgi:triacylglycerol lipase
MPADRLRAPIVLVHGLFGFNALKIVGWEAFNYFRGVGEFLKSKGNRVSAPALPPMAGVVERAAELVRFIREHHANEKVHLLAHSLGGLDSRYAISRLGLGDQVLSLTTLATPHQGSPVASSGVRRLESFLKPYLLSWKVSHEGIYDLTTERCRQFNEDVPDHPDVKYYAVAGHCHGAWLGPEWWLPYGIVRIAEGPNDGVVSLQSAHHHYEHETWEGDHLSLVNWPNPRAIAQGVWRSRNEQYLGLIRRLVRMGFGEE